MHHLTDTRHRVWPYLASGLIALGLVLTAVFTRSTENLGRPSFHFSHVASQSQPLPRPQENVVEAMTPAAAIVVNASVPFSREPLEVAHGFSVGTSVAAAVDKTVALDCLAAAVYYEASGEGEAGERAVAQVVLNRVRHPAFPSTVCGVVYQGSDRQTGCQFTFTCDGSLARKPTEPGWSAARRLAGDALNGRVDQSIGMATHYHANYVVPYWAAELSKIAAVGNHIFYRWPGYWGRRAAFRQSYSGETRPESELAATDILQVQPVRPADKLGALSAPMPLADVGLHKLSANQLSMPSSVVPLRADENKGTLTIDADRPPISKIGPLASIEPKRPSANLEQQGRTNMRAAAESGDNHRVRQNPVPE